MSSIISRQGWTLTDFIAAENFTIICLSCAHILVFSFQKAFKFKTLMPVMVL